MDLLGQSRLTDQVNTYFATDDKLLVSTAQNQILVFDQDGYI